TEPRAIAELADAGADRQPGHGPVFAKTRGNRGLAPPDARGRIGDWLISETLEQERGLGVVTHSGFEPQWRVGHLVTHERGGIALHENAPEGGRHVEFFVVAEHIVVERLETVGES